MAPAPRAGSPARAHLLYGEWLRRENRRVDAREQLSRAHETLRAIGADGFAERARRELLATGQTVRKRTQETERDLTAQEMQIAVRARDGQTNTEIGAELFLSPRTVEWHLRKVFGKLGITSRRQLRHTLHGTVAVPSGLTSLRLTSVLLTRSAHQVCSLARTRISLTATRRSRVTIQATASAMSSGSSG
jgi:DNA-binding CsgD family transcriptional regulator